MPILKINENKSFRLNQEKEISEMKFTDKDHNYIESDEEREVGHEDTRRFNHECEDPDPNLGCNLGIDVQG